MIHRANYLKVRAFLEYLEQVAQLRPGSISLYQSHLKHLVLWAGQIPFKDASEIRPSFPTYLAHARIDGRRESLAPATVKKIVQISKRFLRWAKLMYPSEFGALSQLWIDSLRAPHVTERLMEHEFVTLEEIKAIARMNVAAGDTIMLRDRAAACLLFLSGMRAGAFASLPILALNVAKHQVQQWPALGVRTKMGKTATTFLLDIPELLAPVVAWDAVIRNRLPPTAMWYTPTVGCWGEQRLSSNPPGAHRTAALRKRMLQLFNAAGLPHKSPHKFRHGHAVFALHNARTMADYKAVSMNLMHTDITVTDGIYATLASQDVQRRISALTATTSKGRMMNHAADLTSAGLSREEVAGMLIDLARKLAG